MRTLAAVAPTLSSPPWQMIHPVCLTLMRSKSEIQPLHVLQSCTSLLKHQQEGNKSKKDWDMGGEGVEPWHCTVTGIGLKH